MRSGVTRCVEPSLLRPPTLRVFVLGDSTRRRGELEGRGGRIAANVRRRVEADLRAPNV